MARKRALFAIATGLVLALASHAADAAAKIKIGFLPGVVDPFYQVMQIGVETAAKELLGVEVVTQFPRPGASTFRRRSSNSMIARGDLNYIVTAPTDKDRWSAR